MFTIIWLGELFILALHSTGILQINPKNTLYIYLHLL